MTSEAKVRALLKSISTGKLESDRQRILHYAIKLRRFTIHDIRLNLEIPHQSATARVSELFDLGLIKEHDSSGKYTIYEVELDTHKQKIHQQKVMRKKFEKWLKKADDFREFIPNYLFPFLRSIK